MWSVTNVLPRLVTTVTIVDLRMDLPSSGYQFWKYFIAFFSCSFDEKILPKYIRICVYDAKIPFLHLLEGNKVKNE